MPFSAHPEAGQRSAILYSLIISYQRHGNEPLAHPKDLLTCLPRMANQYDVRRLLPANRQPANTWRLDLIGHHRDDSMVTIEMPNSSPIHSAADACGIAIESAM